MRRRRFLTLTLMVFLLLVGVMWHLLNLSAALPVLAKPIEGATTGQLPVPSTPNDFVLSGTQPNTLVHSITDPSQCETCHKGYVTPPEQQEEQRTWEAWQGSMMAQAGRDPVFFAALDIANAGAANAGEFCLRCHLPRGWLEGRSSNPDGSEMTREDREGVQCETCHRMVDPTTSPDNPERDTQILADLELPVTSTGSGQMIIDPEDFRRGPFDVVADLNDNDPHELFGAYTLVSPYHQEAELCGTCHDINNPMFTWNEGSLSYEPNLMDQQGPIEEGFPIERTYTEWKLSDYNSAQGVYAPQFGGNKTYVSVCQDCHMHDITGTAGALFGGPGIVRQDMPLHDLTGGNTWVPQTIPLHPEFGALFPEGSPRAEALKNGIERARSMLQKAARLEVEHSGTELTVTIFNDSGHKLPTGYVEGRRMWLSIAGYNADCKLVYTSGAYDRSSGELQGYHSDPTLKVYESKHGLTQSWADQLQLPAGPSFHFALNNMIVSDNRIPPRGYEFEAYNAGQAAPYTDGTADSTMYADGQYWDTTEYELPADVVWGNVLLLYQTSSKEYIEFLRTNNPNESPNNGDILYNLWQQTGKSTPEVLSSYRFGTDGCSAYLPAVRIP
jgi:Cytochrome c554 and c-prime